MRRGLNQFEREVLEDTGLSISQFAHIRNRVCCCYCKQWFRASKYLWKDKIQEDKDADAWGAYIHPNILCGKCGAISRIRVSEGARFPRKLLHAKRPKRMSKRRWKIMVQRGLDRWEWDDA